MDVVSNEYIEITPGIVGGKPRIAGRRITVQNVVVWHERMGKSADEIATEYDLTLAEVYAALAFYFDHRAEIDESIREGEAFAEEASPKQSFQVGSEARGARAAWLRGSGFTPTNTCRKPFRLPFR